LTHHGRHRRTTWTAWILSLALAGCALPPSVDRHAGDLTEQEAGALHAPPFADGLPEPRIYEAHEIDFPPEPTEPIAPAYPRRARRLGREGDVGCRVVVRADGRVGDVRIASSTDPEFETAAVEAIRRTRFRPAVRRGRPVAAHYEVLVRFRLG
jgi:TonB family protein